MSKDKTLPSSIGMLAGNIERLPELAAELVRLKVDVIVAGGTQSTRAANEGDQYDSYRLVAVILIRLATGLSPALRDLAATLPDCQRSFPELSGKRLELLKEIIPQALARGRPWEFNEPGQRTIR